MTLASSQNHFGPRTVELGLLFKSFVAAAVRINSKIPPTMIAAFAVVDSSDQDFFSRISGD